MSVCFDYYSLQVKLDAMLAAQQTLASHDTHLETNADGGGWLSGWAEWWTASLIVGSARRAGGRLRRGQCRLHVSALVENDDLIW